MKTMTRFACRAILLSGLALGSSQLQADPPLAGPQGPPVWCFGLNQFDQCVLYLGTEQSCKHLEKCTTPSVTPDPSTPDPTFCFGENDLGECQLFLGSREQCNNVVACRAVNGKLPRAPRLTAPR
jgi:hypothetical protein